MSRTSTFTESTDEYDADNEYAAALKALSEAAWRLNLASYAVMEQRERQGGGNRGIGGGEGTALSRDANCMAGRIIGVTDLLEAHVRAIASETRKLRKLARDG